jgi:hypothetical protein
MVGTTIRVYELMKFNGTNRNFQGAAGIMTSENNR